MSIWVTCPPSDTHKNEGQQGSSRVNYELSYTAIRKTYDFNCDLTQFIGQC
jgi:hypothetical protein